MKQPTTTTKATGGKLIAPTVVAVPLLRTALLAPSTYEKWTKTFLSLAAIVTDCGWFTFQRWEEREIDGNQILCAIFTARSDLPHETEAAFLRGCAYAITQLCPP